MVEHPSGQRLDKVYAMKKEITAVIAVAAALAVFSIDTKVEKGSEKRVGLTKLALLDDGGKVYVVDIQTDAGVQTVISKTPGCVRRLAGAAAHLCMFQLDDGGLVDQGELNRIPESRGVGPGCAPAACSVMQNEDADEDEDEHIAREKGGESERPESD